MDWISFMEKKQAELMNTGHIMDDETFITHLLNSLPSHWNVVEFVRTLIACV